MKRKLFLLSTLSVLSLGLVATSVFASKQNISITYAYPNGDAATYYNDVSSSLDGTQLLTKLQELNQTKRRTLINYNNLFSYYKTTDPGTSSGKVTSFYTGKNCSNVTREHVWPYSKLVLNDHTGNTRGDNDIEKDLHMVRPADSSINEDRGNSFFTMPDGQGWDPGGLGDETYRGEAARIIFYCVVADGQLSLVDKDYDAWSNHTMGKLSDLLRWNLQYSITNREKTRNEAVEQIQGHRNPFVDHPEYACKIWGNTNSTTELICKSNIEPSRESEVEDLYLGQYEQYMEVGDTQSLNAFIEPYELTNEVKLNWMSSNTNVATVTHGFITAVGLGETTITVATNPTGMKSTSCVIKVVEDKTNPGGENPPDDPEPPVTPDPPKTNNNNGCGGNIVTTSVILSTLSILGISLILIRKFMKYEE